MKISLTAAVAVALLLGCSEQRGAALAPASPVFSAVAFAWPSVERPSVVRVTYPLVNVVPVTKGELKGGAPVWVVLYSVELKDVLEGSLVEASGDIELTNDTHHGVSLVARIVRATSPQGTPYDSETISGGGGENVTPEIHHALRAREGEFVADRDYAKLYVNFAVRAVSSAAAASDVLTYDDSALGRFVVKISEQRRAQ